MVVCLGLPTALALTSVPNMILDSSADSTRRSLSPSGRVQFFSGLKNPIIELEVSEVFENGFRKGSAFVDLDCRVAPALDGVDFELFLS